MRRRSTFEEATAIYLDIAEHLNRDMYVNDLVKKWKVSDSVITGAASKLRKLGVDIPKGHRSRSNRRESSALLYAVRLLKERKNERKRLIVKAGEEPTLPTPADRTVSVFPPVGLSA